MQPVNFVPDSLDMQQRRGLGPSFDVMIEHQKKLLKLNTIEL
jgi:hypothetical protein